MVTEPGKEERRAHTRYHVKEKVMLYNGTTFAEVVNISEGGIFCRFLMDTKNQTYPVHTVDLIDAPKKLFIQKVTCVDLNWQNTKPRTLFGTTALRDCRLQFSNLSPEKNSELREFIQQAITNPTISTPTDLTESDLPA